jgi:hypothetical protein
MAFSTSSVANRNRVRIASSTNAKMLFLHLAQTLGKGDSFRNWQK